MQEQWVENFGRLSVSDWLPLNDLTDQLGKVTLCETDKGHGDPNAGKTRENVSAEDVEPGPLEGDGKATASAVPAGLPGRNCPGTPEPNSWGDFEGFSEASDEAESFALEAGARSDRWPPEEGPPSKEEHFGVALGSRLSSRNIQGMMEAASISSRETQLNYENIFKFAFRDVLARQLTEDILTLDQFLEARSEENAASEPGKRPFCSNSRKLWRTLRDANSAPTSRCLWTKSHCLDNFLLVLGIDSTQKDPSGSNPLTSEGANLKEIEELMDVNGFNIHNCKALIQTKLSVSPSPRHGNLFIYNLFLKKTPSHGTLQYITTPRKRRLFTTRSLKMKIFKSDVC
ncbi:uncharacterized protein CLBA1 [Ornithorhynchus anatinus]|uniref:Clathrin binding box of aftiphilin containing 1 n=1 Tax=Ornithorhynchus anatinus TaxID=9258 RepID=K7EGZ3_ORNAN|nr:uncharacterized protein CLBA1 [Ornithorhynchus anatinus]